MPTYLAEVDELLAPVVVLVEKSIVRCLQPAVPHPGPRRHRRVRPVGVDRREVAAARDVVLGRLERARPEILEVLDAVVAVRLGVVQLHCRQMTSVTTTHYATPTISLYPV